MIYAFLVIKQIQAIYREEGKLNELSSKATYLIASPFTIAKFADVMQSMAPEYPIIKAEKVEPEVYRVINAILETEQSDITVAQAYLLSEIL